jgi:hypothetical protein
MPSRGIPVWGWVLLGFGGIVVLGGVMAGSIAIGRKMGEKAQTDSTQSKADPEQIKRLQEELDTLRKEESKKTDPNTDQIRRLQEELDMLRNERPRESEPAPAPKQSWLGEWTQVAGPGTMHVEFRPDGTTKSWISLTKDQLTSTGKLMKAGTIMPDSKGNPLFIEGWWKMMNDGRLMVQTDKDSTDLPKDFTQEMNMWSKKK